MPKVIPSIKRVGALHVLHSRSGKIDLRVVSVTVLVVVAAVISMIMAVGKSDSMYVFDGVQIQNLDFQVDVVEGSQTMVVKRIRNSSRDSLVINGFLSECRCLGALNLPLEVGPESEALLEIGVFGKKPDSSSSSVITQKFSFTIKVHGKVLAVPGTAKVRVFQKGET